ncbi:hypothetical protein IHE45_18G028000 [Dioscorea alata]|uniref:Uncharacterized protein n=1 Tax=Dioscorea alata TaxID=55571 RepID=A0ACB7U5T7_DIOAL|nr:hypothetical protein IHE45_18G028000 [Dioscorea alata]
MEEQYFICCMFKGQQTFCLQHWRASASQNLFWISGESSWYQLESYWEFIGFILSWHGHKEVAAYEAGSLPRG